MPRRRSTGHAVVSAVPDAVGSSSSLPPSALHPHHVAARHRLLLHRLPLVPVRRPDRRLAGVLGAKIVLAVVFIGLFFALMWVNLLIADRLAPKFRPAGPEEELIERYHELVGRRQGLLRVGVSALFAVIAGAGVSGQWNE